MACEKTNRHRESWICYKMSVPYIGTLGYIGMYMYIHTCIHMYKNMLRFYFLFRHVYFYHVCISPCFVRSFIHVISPCWVATLFYKINMVQLQDVCISVPQPLKYIHLRHKFEVSEAKWVQLFYNTDCLWEK
jgi:hypothetical protein